MKSNFLYDKNFLQELFGANERTVFARVTALTQKERPIEYIEGKVTGGSINIDGTSRVRRTCSLTLVAQDININDFYWGVKNKFKLEIGLKNNIDSKYPDICWFKQGLYVITSFSTSYGTNNYTISISGKDKMCLLNGDLAGALPHTTDFGIEEYYDKENNITTYTSVPLKRIIRESVQNFGNELPQNIIVNDLEDAGLNLLEYRGDTPIYMFRNVDTDTFINMTLDGSLECFIKKVKGKEEKEEKVSINDVNKIKYDNLVNLTEGEQPTKVRIGSNYYTIAKFEYGSIPGYELTDLVYAGDLICNVGETLTSMLDKIVNMLGEFEYFYNLDGEFVFQKKQTYVDVYWNDIEKGDQIYANAAVNKSTPIWNFTDNQLVSAFQNTPNILNLRNDFAIWGKKKTTSGTEIDIHMRYAIDKKPIEYYSLIDQKRYATQDKGDKDNPVTVVDWRELIYKMALDYRKYYHNDDFLFKLAQDNPQYPDGHTGYEQYYVDMEGFWRQIYDPNGAQTVSRYEQISSETATNLYGQTGNQQNDVFIKNAFVKPKDDELKSIFGESKGKNIFLIEKDGTIKPYLYGACYVKTEDEEGNPINRKYYSLNNSTNKMTEIDTSNIEDLKIKIEDVYVNNICQLRTSDNLILRCNSDDDSEKKKILQAKIHSLGKVPPQDSRYIQLIGADLEDYIDKGDDNSLRIQSPEYLNFADLKDPVKQIYYNSKFIKSFSYHDYDIIGRRMDSTTSKEIQYYSGQYDYGSNGWAKIVTSNPESLIFWFDFLDAEGSNLEKYSVNAIGTRSKAVSDNDVKCIYYREIPQTIFQSGAETYEHQTGYTYIQLRPEMKNLFIISSKGKSAQEELENMLYKYSYSIESANITVLPVYHLEPNTRILIKDQNSKINGEYVVSRITIPLTYNGTMSLTATKVISNIT